MLRKPSLCCVISIGERQGSAGGRERRAIEKYMARPLRCNPWFAASFMDGVASRGIAAMSRNVISEDTICQAKELIMTKIAIAEDIAERIRSSEGPIELVDTQGQTIGVVRRPPTEAEIERARNRASKDGKRLSWAQVAAKVRHGIAE